MKRLIPAMAVLLLIAAAPAYPLDSANPAAGQTVQGTRTVIVVNDVIRMSRAGVSDDAIINYVRNLREPFAINADDVIAMTDAHVSPAVIKVVQDEAAAWQDRQPAQAVAPQTRTQTVYVAPAYYYDPWFYPYYYDPYWYGPRLSFGIGFGYVGRGFGGFHGGFHGRHH